MFQTHHNLLRRLKDHPVLKALGRNIDEIGNRMKLPATRGIADELQTSPHTGGHLGSYYKGFLGHLDRIESSDQYRRGLAGKTPNLDAVAEEFDNFLAAAKYAQANGHLFPNTPTGMTREQANEINERWFESWREYAEKYAEPIRQMRDTIDQLAASGQWNGALHWPLLSPSSALSLEERSAIVKKYGGSPGISLHFNAVGPAPALPGFVPSLIDTRLPGFIPAPRKDLEQSEGFSINNSSAKYGLPGFLDLDSRWQRIGQPPPRTSAPSMPQILQFNEETGQPITFSDGSPMMGPNRYDMPRGPGDPSPLLGLGIFAAAMAAPALIPSLPAWLGTVGALGGAGLATTSFARAQPTNLGGGVFATGAPPYNPFAPGAASTGNSERDEPVLTKPDSLQTSGNGLQQELTTASTFDGGWPSAPAVLAPTRPTGESDPSISAGSAPKQIRRLTRVDTSNTGSVFEFGTSPVPFASPAPPRDGSPHRTSVFPGVFADDPASVVAPPIFFGKADPHDRPERWFSRWNELRSRLE